MCGCAGYTYGAAGVWALKWDPADTRWTNYNHRIDGWYAGMDLPGSRQMTLLKRFFLDLPWHLLTPRFSDPAWAQFTDREESVLATCGQDLYVAYFYGPSRSPGTLRNLDPGVSYRADWFDPRTGVWTPIDMNLRADNGQWTIPTKPDGDWVLVVRPDRSSERGEGSSGERASARKPPADLNSHR